MIRKILAFVLTFGALQLSWQAIDGSSAAHFVVDRLVVAPAVFEINLLTPSAEACASGSRVTSPEGGINVINGCDGLDILFMLIAGFVVAPVSGLRKLMGIGVGLLVVHVLNQARLLSLFYAVRHDAALFDALHSLVAPVIVVLGIAIYFYAWTAFPRSPIKQSAAKPSAAG